MKTLCEYVSNQLSKCDFDTLDTIRLGVYNPERTMTIAPTVTGVMYNPIVHACLDCGFNFMNETNVYDSNFNTLWHGQFENDEYILVVTCNEYRNFKLHLITKEEKWEDRNKRKRPYESTYAFTCYGDMSNIYNNTVYHLEALIDGFVRHVSVNEVNNFKFFDIV